MLINAFRVNLQSGQCPPPHSKKYSHILSIWFGAVSFLFFPKKVWSYLHYLRFRGVSRTTLLPHRSFSVRRPDLSKVSPRSRKTSRIVVGRLASGVTLREEGSGLLSPESHEGFTGESWVDKLLVREVGWRSPIFTLVQDIGTYLPLCRFFPRFFSLRKARILWILRVKSSTCSLKYEKPQ